MINGYASNCRNSRILKQTEVGPYCPLLTEWTQDGEFEARGKSL